jgi:hypothetical protein
VGADLEVIASLLLVVAGKEKLLSRLGASQFLAGWVNSGAFPLTPALSRRERVNVAVPAWNHSLAWLRPSAGSVAPSPWGEGRGEGDSGFNPAVAIY